jgi:SAM-dependent methyltransferase
VQHQLYGQIRRIEADHWWYVGRRRITFDWIQRVLGQHDDPRVLDIGCGTGLNLEELRGRGVRRAVGMDIAAAALTHCRARGLRVLVRGDGGRLPFLDGSFDVVVALDLIEHIAEDESALREIARVLAPGGHVVIFTPAYRFLWSLQDEVSHHFRRYTSSELHRKLRLAGFEVRKLTYANTFLFPLVLAGRLALRLRGRADRLSENQLHPAWSNRPLAAIFSAEAGVIRRMNLPFGVSLLAVAARTRT